MPTFKLVQGDAQVLALAYSHLRQGKGTVTEATLEEFLASWSKPGVCAFASESGFVGLTTDEHKRASLTVVPFGENFGPDAGRMVKLLLKTMSLQVVRASCDNTGADALLESMGLRYDGCIRRWAAHQNGNGTQFLDVTFWSMIPEEAEIGH